MASTKVSLSPVCTRRSGILLHPTSLPGKYGIGEIGPEAIKWLDTMKKMGQSVWQLLPLGPTGYGDSPYSVLSAMAANTLLISFDQLVKDKLLKKSELANYPKFNPHHVEFGKMIPPRREVLQTVVYHFPQRASKPIQKAFQEFCKKNVEWLEDYALFCAIKESQDLRPWWEWPAQYRDRNPQALAGAKQRFADKMEGVRILQFLFDYQWALVRKAADKRGILIMSDIPIFVAHDSVDVWTRRELFTIDTDGSCTHIAGIPPDVHSKTGQRWGNPLFKWEVHRKEKYAWWAKRVRRNLDWGHVVRVDHFCGFGAFWKVPGKDKTAENGQWVDGPKSHLFSGLQKYFGQRLPIVAENLGFINVDKILNQFSIPGMRIFQFGFWDGPGSETFLPHAYIPNCIAYPGNHDNNTLQGWAAEVLDPNRSHHLEETKQEVNNFYKYFGKKPDIKNLHWRVISDLLNSKAGAAVFPMPDLLGLGLEARMNHPSTLNEKNWAWRFDWKQLTPAIVKKMRDLTAKAKRIKK